MAKPAQSAAGPSPSSSAIVLCPNCGVRNRLRPSAEGVPRCARCEALLPWITRATQSSFDQELEGSVPVLVEFGASWCAPCRTVKPVVERLAREYAGRLKVVEVDVDAEEGLAARWQAMSIPLLVLVRDGRELDRIVGAPPPAELERRVEQVVDRGEERVGSTA